ncbi:DUF4338 domain-containing protein [Alphaproteobacteria bacterium]|nr:DUF4338 domain-containing protein [Alphaproteobacteria bacterium]
MTEKTFVPFDMEIDDADHHWSAFSSALHQIKAEFKLDEYSEIASAIRKYADSAEGTYEQSIAGSKNTIDLKVYAFAFVLADLVDQRWSFELSDNGLYITRSANINDLVKKQLLSRRNASLETESVQNFLTLMENPGPTSSRKSIRHIIHDGSDLAKQLGPVLDGRSDISDIIAPVIQVVESGQKDKITGHYLTDIWRYCRLTWSLEYQSIPGRQMTFLIRNGAHPKKVIMGIGSLASPVLQHRLRDDWIGWTYDGVLAAYATGKLTYSEIVEIMSKSLIDAMSDLYIDDLDITADEIQRPSFATIYKLESIAEKEKDKRLEILRSDAADEYRKKVIPAEMSQDEILERTLMPLFKSKRAARLAKLLKVKSFLNKLSESENAYKATQLLFNTGEGKSALGFAIGELRTAGAASRVADLNVCGAIPPYNHLIGGKLVALSVFSDEIQKHYKERYQEAESEISTFMAGRRIIRPTNLEVITTTSLYGNQLNQYHGLRLKKARHPKLTHDCEWLRLGNTIGEGTFQFSNLTNSVLQKYMKNLRGYRQVNNVFGEGTSPKMRNLRTAIGTLGFNSEEVMTHKQERLFLASQLNPKSKQRLMNKHLKNATKRSKFRDISNAWIDQWVKNRVNKDGLLEKISSENFERLASSLRPASYDGQYKLL